MLTIRDDIVLDLPRGPIGISFSGGADSSLLVYLVLNQIKDETIHLFTISTIERNLTQHKTTSDVLNKICRITNNYNVIHHVSIHNTNAEGINHIQSLPKKMLYEDENIKSILYGDNCNPPKDCSFKNIKNFNMFKQPARSPLTTRSLKPAPGQYCPLTNLNKKDICKIYQKEGILESVFPITKSCGTEYGKEPCGVCWFCVEREWGLEALD